MSAGANPELEALLEHAGWVQALARVLRNQVMQQGRSEAARAGRERRRASREALPSAAEITERASMQRRLVDHVLALDEPHRSALLYRFRFELVPVSELSGRVLGVPSDERIGLSLVDGAGRAIPLPIDNWPSSFAPLAADCRFALPVVPTGSFRLRVGSEAELARGVPRLEMPIEILAGVNPPLEIALR